MTDPKESSRKILGNIFSLFSLQLLNYLLPLITFPFIVRMIGPEKFGVLSFAQAFVQYFVLFSEYGFHLSATQEIARDSSDPDKLSQDFSRFMGTKFFLTLLTALLFFPIVFSFDFFRGEWRVLCISFLIVLGNALFPMWIFQGLEKMHFITLIHFWGKSVQVLLIFLFIRQPEDYLLVALFQSGTLLVIGVAGFFWALKNFKLTFRLPGSTAIRETLRSGWPIFATTVSMNIYSTSNVFFLGLLTNHETVGYYSGAEKIIRALNGIWIAVSQAIFPRIASLAAESEEKTFAFLRRAFKGIALSSFLFSIALFAGANWIPVLLLGKKFLPSIPCFLWLAALPFFVAMTNVFSVQIMLPFGMKDVLNRVCLQTALFDLCCIFPLVYYFQANGAAMACFFSEGFIMVRLAQHLARTRFWKRLVW